MKKQKPIEPESKLTCPCCGDLLVSQPTVGDNFRQFKCFGQYLTKDEFKSDHFKCEYLRIERDGVKVYEFIKNMYARRSDKATR